MNLRSVVLIAALAAGTLGTATTPSFAQQSLQACSTQQELEQTLGSNGSIVPDGCRTIAIGSLVSGANRLCRIDLSSGDQGILSRLQDAAVPTEYWVRCDELAAAATAR